jgi:hypothetical protein
MAFAFRLSAMQGVGTQLQLCGFQDTGAVQVDLRINPDGSFNVTRNGTILGSSFSGIGVNAYHHFEIETTIHPTAGTVQVWIDGISRLSLTSQNTRFTANSSANSIFIGSIVNQNIATVLDFDDIVVYDSQANDPQGHADIVGPIGDCALTWSLPNGAGTSTQWTPDSGSNYARVNEVTPDGDTSYVLSSTVGQIDTYAMADLPASVSSVKSIAAVHYSRKDDAGSRSISSELRTGGTNYAGSTVFPLSTSYQYGWGGSWGVNPNTGIAWTLSDINAIEVGRQLIS